MLRRMGRWTGNLWVFLLAAAVIIVSTAVLYAGIGAAQEAELKMVAQVETRTANLPPTSEMVEEEGVYHLPDFLLAFDEDNSDLPGAKDIGSQQAADTGAKLIEQVFGADLDGEVCDAVFYNSVSAGFENRGIWMLSFGAERISGSHYFAEIDSVSGAVRGISKYSVAAEAAAIQEENDFVLEDEEAYARQCEETALKIAQEYLLGNREIVENTRRGAADLAYMEPAGTVQLLLSDGTGIEFGFVQNEGLVYVSFYSKDDMDAMSDAELTELPAPAAEAE